MKRRNVIDTLSNIWYTRCIPNNGTEAPSLESWTELGSETTRNEISRKLKIHCRFYRSEEISSAAEAEARASAKQLVALQQRLASLKDAVAAAQRVAAAREAAAAAAIQRNAAATAAELQKQDVDKQISRSEQEAKVRYTYSQSRWVLEWTKGRPRTFLFSGERYNSGQGERRCECSATRGVAKIIASPLGSINSLSPFFVFSSNFLLSIRHHLDTSSLR